jgi:protein-disulfide isomerase
VRKNENRKSKFENREEEHGSIGRQAYVEILRATNGVALRMTRLMVQGGWLLALFMFAGTLASAQQADFTITVGTPKLVGNSGLSEVSIDVKSPDGSDTVKMFLTADGRYLIRGELNDLTVDPLAENISKFDLKGAPVLGDPKAPITIVEYGDFECPVCRNFHDALRGLLPKYPQAKLIFKDFPIDQIHPWARTAALAGRCAYQQDPKAFWKMYDLIYDNQDLVSASNAYEKMMDFAGRAGLNTESFKSCLSGPQAPAEVNASLENGKLVNVRSTPTVFVNGRPLSGADPHALQQYLDFEVAKLKTGKL